jgi:DNA-binding GntR family transcriptional regulator
MKPLRKSNLCRQVADHLFDAIVRGEFRPGERLVEWRLARELGVAQSTLREALMELEHKGLVVRKARQGTFVTELSLQEIEQIYAVRIQLEPYAAALACQRMSEQDHARLRSLVEEIAAAGQLGDPAGISHADARFHDLIWELSGNDLLNRLLALVYRPLWAFELIRLYSAPTYDFRRTVKEHEELLEVLKTGNPEEVGGAFRAMLQLFCSQDIENLRALEVRENPEQIDGSRAGWNEQQKGLLPATGEAGGQAKSVRGGQ